jgi:hypothetical protein
MDDPRGPHSEMRSEEDFRRLRPLSASTFKLKNLNEWVSWLQRDARHLQRSSFNPKDHLGWRARARRKVSRLLRRDLTPGV